jgi:5-methylcytosine-specific restriction enzyme B
MPIDLDTLSVDQLKNLISNYESEGRTDSAVYQDAISLLDKKVSRGLDLRTTVKTLVAAARNRKFISYGDVAIANGSDWSKVRRLMPIHLDNVLSYCHQRRLPYLTAIVVSKPNLDTGRFDPENLKGFTNGLRRLGLKVTDQEEYARAEQNRVFDWAQTAPFDL